MGANGPATKAVLIKKPRLKRGLPFRLTSEFFVETIEQRVILSIYPIVYLII